MNYHIACHSMDTKSMKHFEVPESVYTYIRQLEQAVKYPHNDRIREAYPKRFGKDMKNTS